MSTRARDFWDEQARWNALVAILDGEAIRDPARGEEAFVEEGVATARMLRPFVHPEARVVDLGCGIGRVVRPLAEHAREVVGVDVSEEMLARAQDHLRGVENQRLVLTDGRSLPGIADGSVDFLYSVLCFIHVDRRSAFRYFGEIARVLASDGRALLQFHDVLSPAGIAKFEGAVDSDYPLEFYTREELAFLLRRNGLDVLECTSSEEYLFVQVVRSSADAWLTRWHDGVRLAPRGATGWFADARASRQTPSELRAELVLLDSAWRGFRLLTSLRARGKGDTGIGASALFFLRGPGRHELCLREGSSAKPLAIDLDGRELDVEVAGGFPAPGPAELRCALLPAGLHADEQLVARFFAFAHYLELLP